MKLTEHINDNIAMKSDYKMLLGDIDLKVKCILTTALIGCGLLSFGLAGTAFANQGQNSCEPTELVNNGSFEEPYLGPNRWQPFQQIEGWTLAYGPAIEVQNNVAGSPHDGEQFVELGQSCVASIVGSATWPP